MLRVQACLCASFKETVKNRRNGSRLSRSGGTEDCCVLTEKFIHLGIASCPAGPDMLAEMDRRAFPMAIDETKLPFWGEVNGLLRERVGCDAAVEFEFPTYRGNGGIVQPL